MSYKDAPEIAAKALSDLNMFYAIRSLTEHSLIHSGEAEQQTIRAACDRASTKCLRVYDAALAKCRKAGA